MIYREYPPPAGLRHLVACVWHLRTTAAVPNFSIRPDGCLDIIRWPDGKLHVSGVMTQAAAFDLPSSSTFAGIRFLPGAASSLLREPLHRLNDRTVLLDHLVSPPIVSALHGHLAGCVSPPTSSLTHLSESPTPVQRAIAHLAQCNGLCSLDELARHAGLGPRQFRRRCLDECGLSPKLLARILRFQHALACAARGRCQSWASVAAHCGYFDQAHLIRDFHQFARASPMSVLSKAQPLFSA